MIIYDGEAKFWLDPIVSLEKNYGVSPQDLSKLQKIIEERKYEIIRAWKKNFSG